MKNSLKSFCCDLLIRFLSQVSHPLLTTCSLSRQSLSHPSAFLLLVLCAQIFLLFTHIHAHRPFCLLCNEDLKCICLPLKSHCCLVGLYLSTEKARAPLCYSCQEVPPHLVSLTLICPSLCVDFINGMSVVIFAPRLQI